MRCPSSSSRAPSQSQSLDLSGKNLGVASAIVIASLISVNGALTKLSLAKNKLGEEGTKFLCDALVGNNTLKELDLSGHTWFGGTGSNIGGTASAKHVANMLLVNGSLTKMKYVTFRSAPSSHILPLTLPTALCNLTTRPLFLCLCAALTTTASIRKPSKPSETLGGAPPPN